MFLLNSEELCVYNLLCDGAEILLECFNNYTQALNYIKNNSL